MPLSETYSQGLAIVDTESDSPGFVSVHSAEFATIPSGRRVSAETEATQTLVVLELH